MGILDKIKNDVKKSGSNKGKIVFIKEGAKGRFRFLQDMDEGLEIIFHDSYDKGINYPCRENYGKDCPGCDDEDLRTRSMYAWSVYDYDANDVKVFLYAVNNCSPLPAIAAMYETYGTLTDRDFVISRTGKAQNTSFSVVPMDKQKFRNSKIKPLSKQKILEIIDKAFPYEGEEDDNKDDWGSNEEGNAYEDMTAKELYKLCEEREIECEPKKPQKYYINLLEEADKAQDDWGDEDEDEDVFDYESMTPKELYKLCKERDIDCKPKQKKDYYVEKLKAADSEDDDEWEDDSDDEWDE